MDDLEKRVSRIEETLRYHMALYPYTEEGEKPEPFKPLTPEEYEAAEPVSAEALREAAERGAREAGEAEPYIGTGLSRVDASQDNIGPGEHIIGPDTARLRVQWLENVLCIEDIANASVLEIYQDQADALADFIRRTAPEDDEEETEPGDALEMLIRELESQDNLATSDPIYMVQEKRRIYGIVEGYGADGSIFTLDGEEVEPDGVDVKEENCKEVFFKDEWVNSQPFLTRKAASEFIERQRHNLKSPRIYVESGYHNREWRWLRDFLPALKSERARNAKRVEELEGKLMHAERESKRLPEYVRGNTELRRREEQQAVRIAELESQLEEAGKREEEREKKLKVAVDDVEYACNRAETAERERDEARAELCEVAKRPERYGLALQSQLAEVTRRFDAQTATVLAWIEANSNQPPRGFINFANLRERLKLPTEASAIVSESKVSE